MREICTSGSVGALGGQPPRATRPFRRISCDAGLVPMLYGRHGQAVDVGRRTRTIPPSLRRALWSRDGGCQFPGCTNRLYVHAHHIDHWAHGGPTSADNLVLLCSAHHRLVHEGGFQVSHGSGAVEFRDPQGRLVNRCPPAAPANDWWMTICDVEIDENTNFPAWDGTPVDYDATVSALWECRT